MEPIQIALIAAAIDSLDRFDGDLTHLAEMQARTKAALNALDIGHQTDDLRAARREWGQNEIIYALALDQKSSTLRVDEREGMWQAVRALRGFFDGLLLHEGV
ncbi:hypothetical protein [Microbacterium azadirachtae]|uniref:hypothetical protein n=1 Tax=Microbacterium azadirachtae TaxID=582680 RepID=UPI00126A3D35|nr:hypothetical protein [Microbacterium azadirachtae]